MEKNLPASPFYQKPGPMVLAATLVARAAYGYNTADQRVALTNADNSYWLYDKVHSASSP